MNHQYEFLEYNKDLPIRTNLHSVGAVPPHWHQELEILLVLEGSVYVFMQNTTQRIKKGELIVISPNLIHFTQQTEQPNLVLALQINCNQLGPNGETENPDQYQFVCSGGRQAHPQIVTIRKSICAIMLEQMYQQPGYIQIATSHVQIILGTLFRYFLPKDDVQLTVPTGKAGDRILRMLKYINDHHSEHLSLNDIAAREYISISHLSSYFRKMLGMSFTDYLNTVRLKAYVDYMETESTLSLDEIAEMCGFSSPQYAAKLFSKAYQTTPGKYRRELAKKESVRLQALQAKQGENYIAVYTPIDLNGILKYWMQQSEQHGAMDAAVITHDACRIDCTKPAIGQYHRSALRLTTIGRAYEGLLSHVQDRLRTLQKEIGFTHLRFHGIFSDDMMILLPTLTGGVQYNWRMVDTLIDFMLSIGLKPFLELTYMPTLLASGDSTVFSWKGNITPPASLGMWCALVKALVAHCTRRYGADEVAQWYFEVWNEPDYTDISWTGTVEDFFYFYERTAKAIRQVLPAARICGPSITAMGIRSKKWIPQFMDYCHKNNVPLDGFSFHIYSEIITPNNLVMDLVNSVYTNAEKELQCQLMGQDYAKETIDSVRHQLGKHNTLPLLVTEWNLTLAMYNPINDSLFASTALLIDALTCDAKDVVLAHWTASDYMEERTPLPLSEFHGGFGLTTVNGLRKSSYWAMWALSRLEKEIVYRMPNGIVTRSGNQYALLAFSHPKINDAYAMEYSRPLVSDALRKGDISHFPWLLQGFTGKWRAKRYLYRSYSCDAQLLMQEMNLHEPLSAADIAYLNAMSQPLQREETITPNEQGALEIIFQLHLFDFELITLHEVS